MAHIANRGDHQWQAQIRRKGFPEQTKTFIRRPKEADADAGGEAVPAREAMAGAFGLLPHWAKEATLGRRTYSARSETVTTLPSYRDAWRLGRYCIIPAQAIYEPDWRSGKAVSTRISRADGKPMGIAGTQTANTKIKGQVVGSFSMLTINADDHAQMKNFHKPEDEKRMVVILNEEDYDAWLSAPVERSMESCGNTRLTSLWPCQRKEPAKEAALGSRMAQPKKNPPKRVL